MSDLSDLDTAAHISPEFRDAFTSWRDLHAHVASLAGRPEFDLDRALHQLVLTDVAARLHAAPDYQWVMRGSLVMPTRPAEESLPAAFKGHGEAISPVYWKARPVFDIDLCAHTPAPGLDPSSDHPQRLQQIISRTVAVGDRVDDPQHGIGLGGLVRYSTPSLRRLDTGVVAAEVTAQPIDPLRSRSHVVPVADPITVNLDISPPGKAFFSGPVQQANRSTLAYAMPGFAPFQPNLYPTASQLADKLLVPTAPHWNPPWHRFKDVFDLQYLTDTCRMPAAEMRAALAENPNLAKTGGRGLPVPYRLHGLNPGPGQTPVPWREKYEQMRRDHPTLATYPDFDTALRRIGQFAERLSTGTDAVWQPGRGWRAPTQALSASDQQRLQAMRAAHPHSIRDAAATQTPRQSAPQPRQPDRSQTYPRHQRPGQNTERY